MDRKTFIQVILPLRLEWDPCYYLPEGMQAEVGSRVRVLFAHKEYIGAVSAVDVVPETAVERILPILSVESGLPQVLPEEIRLWKAVASYYLCSVGEVYKAAYPALKREQEAVEAREQERLEAKLEALRTKMEKARRADTRERYADAARALEARLQNRESLPVLGDVDLTPVQETAAQRIREAFAQDKTVLLEGVTGSGKTEIYLKLTRETLQKGNRPVPTTGRADRRRLSGRAGLPLRRIRRPPPERRHPGPGSRPLSGPRHPFRPVPPPSWARAHHRGRGARHFL